MYLPERFCSEYHPLNSAINSYFIGNEATNGGGGTLVYLGNLSYSNSSTFLHFWNSVFEGKEAREFGGGTALIALYSNYASKPRQVIRFQGRRQIFLFFCHSTPLYKASFMGDTDEIKDLLMGRVSVHLQNNVSIHILYSY